MVSINIKSVCFKKSRTKICYFNFAITFQILGLRDLRISTRVFDEISYACDGQSVVLSVNNGNVTSTNSSGVTSPITQSGGNFTNSINIFAYFYYSN